MAQNITLLGASYTAVPAVTLPKTGGGTAKFSDASVTTAVESDVAEGKTFLLADGSIGTGTASGGGAPSATAHTLYFEFTDSTNTTITAYWDDSFISDAITETVPTTYGSKTVTLAQLDGVTWYSFEPTERWETMFDGDINWMYDDNGDYPYCWISSLGNTPITVGSVWKIIRWRFFKRRGVGNNRCGYKCVGQPAWQFYDAYRKGVARRVELYRHSLCS